MGVVLSAGAVRVDTYDPSVSHTLRVNTIVVGGATHGLPDDADVYVAYKRETTLLKDIDACVRAHGSAYGASDADAIAISLLLQAMHRHSVAAEEDPEDVAHQLAEHHDPLLGLPSSNLLAAAIVHTAMTAFEAYAVPVNETALKTCLSTGRWIGGCLPVTDAIEDGEIVIERRGCRPHAFLTLLIVGYRGNDALVVPPPALGGPLASRSGGPRTVALAVLVRHVVDVVTIDVRDIPHSPLFM